VSVLAPLEQVSLGDLTEVEVPEDEFVPLSVRTGQRDAEQFRVLHEGVPSHLHPSLSMWIYRAVKAFRLHDEIQRRLQIEDDGAGVLALIDDDPKLMLDTVDLILWFLNHRGPRSGADRSEQDRIAGLVVDVMSALDEGVVGLRGEDHAGVAAGASSRRDGRAGVRGSGRAGASLLGPAEAGLGVGVACRPGSARSALGRAVEPLRPHGTQFSGRRVQPTERSSRVRPKSDANLSLTEPSQSRALLRCAEAHRGTHAAVTMG